MAGDGTTTATLLADVIVSEGLKNVTAGADALGIRRGIEKATDAIVAAIKADATPVSTKEQIANVGRISAGDAAIGDKIAEAMDAVGNDGAISVEAVSYTHLDVYKRQPAQRLLGMRPRVRARPLQPLLPRLRLVRDGASGRA